MSLIAEHQAYHDLNPADVGLKEVGYIHVARTTSHTGEQFQVACPVYPDDSRADLRKRLNFYLSIIQDRMEDENKAVAELEARGKKSQMLKESIKRNAQQFLQKKKALDKKAKQSKMPVEEYEQQLEIIRAGLKEANAGFEQELQTLGEAYMAPLEEAPKEA